MAYRLYGGSAADFFADLRPDQTIVAVGGATATVAASNGGSPITDLLDINGTPITQITADSAGNFLFQAPDTYGTLWIKPSAAGSRYYPTQPADIGTLASTAAASAASSADRVTTLTALVNTLAGKVPAAAAQYLTRPSALPTVPSVPVVATDGTVSWVAVTALGGAGTGTGGGTGTGTVVKPGVPTSVSITAGTANSFTVKWAAPLTGSAVTGYQVSVSVNDGTPTVTSLAATVTSFATAAITAGSVARVSVTATNGAGASDPVGSAWTAGQTIPTPTTNGAGATVPGTGTSTQIAVRNLTATVGNTTSTVSWTAPANAANVSGYTVSRNGVDSNGSGPYTTTLAASATSFTFTNLVNGTPFTFTITPIVSSGTATAATVTVTPSATGTGGSTGGTTTPAVGTGTVANAYGATTPGKVGVDKLATVLMPARGWFSGGSGDQIDYGNASFGNWRGSPVDAIANWLDTSNGGAWGGGIGGGTASGPIAGFKGLVDIAIGGPSDYSAAKNGSLDSGLRTLLTNLRKNRTLDGKIYPTIIRPFHEMTGNWYAWSVSSGEIADFRATAKRWRGIADQVFPEAIWAFCPNGENVNSGTTLTALFEDGVWDMVGSDRYNQYPHIGTANNGAYTSWEDGAGRGTVDNPLGVFKWLQFAAAHNVPLYFPEYGNNGYDSGTPANAGEGDYWWNNFFTWVRANAGKTGGKVFAEMWFNQIKEENRWILYSTTVATKQPKTAAAYQASFKSL